MAVSLWRSRLTFAVCRQFTPTFACQGSRRDYCVTDSEITVSRRKDSFVVESDAVKDKRRFMDMIEKFKVANPNRRGHVEFIHVALTHLEEFQVQRDLEVYKALFDLFPRQRLRPKNLAQAGFKHMPRHQDCGLAILTHLSQNSIIPDKELRTIIYDVFGPETHVFKKLCRIMFWLPKFKNLSPYPRPTQLPTDAKELAILGIKQITGVDPATEIDIYDCNRLKESLDKTWIVSGQSWKQRKLLLEEKGKTALRIEGPFTLWLKPRSIQYFTLLGERRIKPEVCIDQDDVSDLRLTFFGEKVEPTKDITKLPCVHEQLDGTIFACCATGSSSRDSLLSWLRFLQQKNPILEKLPTVFKLKAPSEALVHVDDADKSTDSNMGPT